MFEPFETDRDYDVVLHLDRQRHHNLLLITLSSQFPGTYSLKSYNLEFRTMIINVHFRPKTVEIRQSVTTTLSLPPQNNDSFENSVVKIKEIKIKLHLI